MSVSEWQRRMMRERDDVISCMHDGKQPLCGLSGGRVLYPDGFILTGEILLERLLQRAIEVLSG